MVETFGDKDAILFEVRWPTEAPSTPAEATRGTLRLWVHGSQVWPGDDLDEAFEWTWIELAEFLARSWRWLLWENGFPFELPGGSIAKVHVDLERRWSLLSMAIREEEEEELYSFAERHDLAQSLMGATAPRSGSSAKETCAGFPPEIVRFWFHLRWLSTHFSNLSRQLYHVYLSVMKELLQFVHCGPHAPERPRANSYRSRLGLNEPSYRGCKATRTQRASGKLTRNITPSRSSWQQRGWPLHCPQRTRSKC